MSLYVQEAILHINSVTPSKHQDIHSLNTRSASNFTLSAHHLSLNIKKPFNSEAKLFNLQPDKIENTDPQQLRSG